MRTRSRRGVYTFDDFVGLVPPHDKADLIDGVIHVCFPESLEHNDLVRWLTMVLGPYIEERQAGRLTVNKVAYRLTDETAPEPDIAFVRTNRLGKLRDGFVDGPPDLAIEIVSPESVDRDYELKRVRYEEAGVGEYWIIDQHDQTVTFLVRENPNDQTPSVTGGFVEAGREGTVFHSRVLPGFWLDTNWLWQRPLPNTRGIVQQILGEKA